MSTASYHYDANGDLDQVTDALGNSTHYVHDRHRRVSAITDAAGGTTQIQYTALGQTAQVRDARNNVTSYSYDGLGNLLSQTSPDTGTTTFSYNATGQLIQTQKADLSLTTLTYDTLGRLKTQSGGGQTRTLTYDTWPASVHGNCTSRFNPPPLRFSTKDQSTLLRIRVEFAPRVSVGTSMGNGTGSSFPRAFGGNDELRVRDCVIRSMSVPDSGACRYVIPADVGTRFRSMSVRVSG